MTLLAPERGPFYVASARSLRLRTRLGLLEIADGPRRLPRQCEAFLLLSCLTMKIERSSPISVPVTGASSVQLVMVLMNGLLDELMRARAHIEHGRHEAKDRSLHTCIEQLATLIHSLDVELGGDATMQLGRLYDDCAVRLNRASRILDVTVIDEVIGLMTALRDAWQRVEGCSV